MHRSPWVSGLFVNILVRHVKMIAVNVAQVPVDILTSENISATTSETSTAEESNICVRTGKCLC
jgi:hypothetical protein